MKKIFILLVLSVISASVASAQKLGYTDMEYITSKMPEYQLAQAEMKKFSVKWGKEIQDKFGEVDRLQRAYMAEEVLLTDDLKRKRQAEIKSKETEAQEYNSKIFGMEGLMFQKKKELMKPVLERVQQAVNKVCSQRRIDIMFDKSSDIGMLYTNPRHDYTDYIIEELGLNEKADSDKNKAVGSAPQAQVGSAAESSNPKQKSTTNKRK
ncbi:outer membrane protein [Dyadobacter jejuensis]|uniref:Outer membrane protein n=1 Tax=Dyadobacter jejuensis TaxID=1082580 RepID=A0A316AJQ0_9BACT|nr:OmpH family outer membrane protein [Dyadobacter jejuensis]PWJ57568.1 outer membrane protein [Dyadobacter jejuensis]